MTEPLTPRISDIRLSYDLIARHTYDVQLLSDEAFRALISLVSACAAGMVWTYSPPGDGSLPDDDERLARVAGFPLKDWLRIRPDIGPFFTISRGRWVLNRPWILIDTRPARAAIPAAVRDLAMRRAGNVCTYCGSEDGPFEYDHIFPLSRGGADDASNITLACAPCNRSKGAKTLREWCGR